MHLGGDTNTQSITLNFNASGLHPPFLGISSSPTVLNAIYTVGLPNLSLLVRSVSWWHGQLLPPLPCLIGCLTHVSNLTCKSWTPIPRPVLLASNSTSVDAKFLLTAAEAKPRSHAWFTLFSRLPIHLIPSMFLNILTT